MPSTSFEDSPFVAITRDYVIPTVVFVAMMYYLFVNIVKPIAFDGLLKDVQFSRGPVKEQPYPREVD